MDAASSHGRYCDVTMIRSLLFHGAAIVHRQSINYLVDFKVICCIFPWNKSIYIIGHNCRLGSVLGVFNKCSRLRPSDTLSSGWLGWHRHARTGKIFVKSYDLSFQNVTVVIQTFVCFLDKRNTLQPLTSLGMSTWPYRVTKKYSYYSELTSDTYDLPSRAIA